MQNEWVNIKASVCKFSNTAFGKYDPKVQYMFPLSCKFKGKEYSVAPGKHWMWAWVGLKFGLNVAEKE